MDRGDDAEGRQVKGRGKEKGSQSAGRDKVTLTLANVREGEPLLDGTTNKQIKKN